MMYIKFLKKNKTKIIALSLVIFYVCSLVFGIYSYKKIDKCQVEGNDNIMVKNGVNKTVSVLHWETSQHWAGWGTKQDVFVQWAGYRVKKKECSVKCEFHGDQSLWNTSDVILFEPQPFGSRGDSFPPDKLCGQKYIMFSYETPLYFPIQSDPNYLDQMDWKMTFEEDSDVRISLICPWGFENGIEAYRNPISTPFKEKKGFAVFVASNCNEGGATYRTDYVKELMSYIPVDSYGLCLQNQPDEALNRNTAKERFESKMKLFSTYKFVLAFENSNFTDYVTEKVSHALLSTSLPVYMGTERVDDYLPGDKSVIKTSDFKSPKELANYLINLSENEQEYMSYFFWKKLLFKKSFIARYKDCLFSAAECKLCERVVQERLSAHMNPTDYLENEKTNSILGSGVKLDYKFYNLHKLTIIIIILLIVVYLFVIYSCWFIPILFNTLKNKLFKKNQSL